MTRPAAVPVLTERERWLMARAYGVALDSLHMGVPSHARDDDAALAEWLTENHPNDQHQIPWAERLAADAPTLPAPALLSADDVARLTAALAVVDELWESGYRGQNYARAHEGLRGALDTVFGGTLMEHTARWLLAAHARLQATTRGEG